MDDIKNTVKRLFYPLFDKELAVSQQKLERVRQFIQEENITNG